MDDTSIKTLLHPFETGLIELPGADGRALFVNAAPGMRLPADFAAALSLSQDFRPAWLALREAGHDVAPQPEGEGYDLVLVLCGRHRGRNELWVAEALRRARPGGRVVVAGGKSEGAASLRKRIGALLDVEGHASKHHGVVFWFGRPRDAEAAIRAIEAANPPPTVEGGYRTAPGMFSHDRADPGSRLLAQSLPAGMSGLAADFGAGWGFLSVALAKRAPGVSAVDLYEASFYACEAARQNMAALAPSVEARVFWRDLLSEPAERRYDVIVMNPPFHQGRAAEPAIGEAMIRAARAALRPGGTLLLVANRSLPYEAVLRDGFARRAEIARDESYKVLRAQR